MAQIKAGVANEKNYLTSWIETKEWSGLRVSLDLDATKVNLVLCSLWKESQT